MKLKLIVTDTQDHEAAVAKWFDENPGIDVKHVAIATGATGVRLLSAIYYKEKEKPGMLLEQDKG